MEVRRKRADRGNSKADRRRRAKGAKKWVFRFRNRKDFQAAANRHGLTILSFRPMLQARRITKHVIHFKATHSEPETMTIKAFADLMDKFDWYEEREFFTTEDDYLVVTKSAAA